MMKIFAPMRHTADSPISWKDIEALPIYAAMALAFGSLLIALLDTMPTIHARTLEAVGIMGSLALRHAWLKLDQDDVTA